MRSLATCACGVLVKAGDDIIRVDKCSFIPRTLRPMVFLNQPLTDGFVLEILANGYRVNMYTCYYNIDVLNSVAQILLNWLSIYIVFVVSICPNVL